MSLSFFLAQAGWSYRPGVETPDEGQLRGARALQAAELHALEVDWQFVWGIDRDAAADRPYDDDGEPLGEEAFYCELRDAAGELLEVLCGIWDPSPEYRRVIQAELAVWAIEGGSGGMASTMGPAHVVRGGGHDR